MLTIQRENNKNLMQRGGVKAKSRRNNKPPRKANCTGRAVRGGHKFSSHFLEAKTEGIIIYS